MSTPVYHDHTCLHPTRGAFCVLCGDCHTPHTYESHRQHGQGEHAESQHDTSQHDHPRPQHPILDLATKNRLVDALVQALQRIHKNPR